jgi:hypothetical protein
VEPTADPFVRSEQAWNSGLPRGFHLAAGIEERYQEPFSPRPHAAGKGRVLVGRG